ncbi:hypothetical protein C943_01900 [Mariniradius saccharolyticus AK6]|uniref:Uncharacterized protein n=1 Tax=Mariniradius saccharolyticus AK6 TaxID=1239962 RepID=M7X9L3_9BACT|nr:hypothetical protein C943_01900 [Mariniradius saccharolyticus AK6]
MESTVQGPLGQRQSEWFCGFHGAGGGLSRAVTGPKRGGSQTDGCSDANFFQCFASIHDYLPE